jgi:hypothetical protein
MVGLASSVVATVDFVCFLILKRYGGHPLLTAADVLADHEAEIGTFMAYVPFDGDVVDFGKETRLVCIGMGVVIFRFESEKGLLLLEFSGVKGALYLLHIDDSIDLACGELAKSVLTTGTNAFLVHMEFFPVFG